MNLNPQQSAALSKALVWLSKHHVPFMEVPEVEFWFQKNSDLIQYTYNSIDDPTTKEMVERYLNAMDTLATISLVARLAGSKDPKVLERLRRLGQKFLPEGEVNKPEQDTGTVQH